MNNSFKYGTYQKSIVFGIITKVGVLNTIGQDNTPHIDFTVKTVEYYRPKSDPSILKEFTKWHQCRAFGKMAEYVDTLNIESGDLVKVEGPFDYSRATDISSAVNQFVTIKVSSINIILKDAESSVKDTISSNDEEIEDNEDVFDFEPLPSPDNTTDVQ